MNKKVIITGIAGQDGSYLAEFLLSKGYDVHGIIRRVVFENQDDQDKKFFRIKHLIDKITLHYGDVTDYSMLKLVIAKVKPDELYHLAAQSRVDISFKDDFSVFHVNTDSTHYILSALKELKPDCRFYFAGTSDMFGNAVEAPQNEKTPFNPVSPYGISKLASYHLTRVYREAYGIFACSGILFNHESPRRGLEFVTKKITATVAKIKRGLEKELQLGDLDANRDWGFAGDYIKAMWKVLQQNEPEDYVIGTGENHTVREFVEIAFWSVGIEIEWHGKGVGERGVDKKTGKTLVVVDEKWFRPIDINELKADATKARQKLDWRPKISFDELVKMMVDSDLKGVSK